MATTSSFSATFDVLVSLGGGAVFDVAVTVNVPVLVKGFTGEVPAAVLTLDDVAVRKAIADAIHEAADAMEKADA